MAYLSADYVQIRGGLIPTVVRVCPYLVHNSVGAVVVLCGQFVAFCVIDVNIEKVDRPIVIHVQLLTRQVAV